MRWWYSLLFCTSWLLVGCDRSGPPVHFVVPDDFHGVFKISVDKHHGEEVTKSNGVIVIAVPTNAHLVVKDDWFFHKWHSVTGRYYTGKTLQNESFAPTNAIVLYDLSTDTEHNNWWLVGTKREQYIAFQFHGELPLGRPLTDDDLPDYANDK